MKIYTKGGDKGRTSLIGGERVGKDDLRVEAYGTVDELSAFVALLRDKMSEQDSDDRHLGDLRDDLERVLGTLMFVQASLAGSSPLEENTERHLEVRIDELNDKLPPIERFTLPGGHPLVSLAHVCRTVCRRAERCAVRAYNDLPAEQGAMGAVADPASLRYLNRLSDYLYMVARTLTRRLKVQEVFWEP